VDGVDGVRPWLAEHVEVDRVAVALEKQDVVGIDRAHGVVQAPVEGADRRAADVARLVDGIVAGHPRLVPIAARERLPQMDHPVLKVLVVPEERPVRRVVAVPALVLAAGQGVQVDDRVETVPRAALDGAVEEPEALLLELERAQVVVEVAIAHGQAHGVEPERGQESGVLVAEEHIEKALEELPRPLVAQGPAQASRCSVSVAGNPVMKFSMFIQPRARPRGAPRAVRRAW
jgi:hypothetical protein